MSRSDHSLGQLCGKVALVTGASRGIGRATALALADLGATVAVHYGHQRPAADEVVAAIEAGGGRAATVHARLGTSNDVADLFDNLAAGLAELGLPLALDILVNNAAIVGSESIEELTATEYEQVMAVNVRAPLFITQRALPIMADHGRVIVISSLVTRTAPREIAYVMSKGAMDSMVRTLAPEVGQRGITVNAVAPGLTETDLMAPVINHDGVRERAARVTALGRVGRPDDIAHAVALLASPWANWITGQVIDASGGLFLRTSVNSEQTG